MLPASNKGVGMNLGFPDVCLTPAPPAPPIPIPYPNLAMHAMAVPFSISVKVSMVNALNMGSEIPLTSGDEAGVANATIMGPGRYTIGNLVVVVEGLPAINLTCPTTGNNMNNPLGAVVVPAVTNVFFTYGGEAAPRAEGRGEPGVDLAAMSRLGEALAPTRGGEGGEALFPGGVALLALPVFSSGVPALVYSAVRRLRGQGLAAMILDLRGHPGGDALAALELAGDFLDEGTALGTATDADGDDTVYRARQEHPYRFPLFLLTDRLTASAAELFAGCLQAHGRAVVVGERTHGKGTAQQLLPGFAEPGAHYATVATFTLPNGEPIEGRGVCPDLAVPSARALEAARAAATHASPSAPEVP